MMRLKHLVFASVLGCAMLATNGCDAIYWNESESLDVVNNKSEIRVLILKNPLIYSSDKTGHRFGIDHDLFENFATHYNLKIKFIPVANEVEMKKALAEGMGDVGAGRLPTPNDTRGFLVGPSYEETYLSLYCQTKARVGNIGDLQDKSISVLSKDNIYGLSDRLTQLAPRAKIQIVTSASAKTLFIKLHRREIDCVIAENLEGQFFSRYYNSVERITALTENYSLSWLIRPGLPDLNRLLQAWFLKASRYDEIMRIHDRYKVYLSELDRSDVRHFMNRTRHTLPEFEREFKKAALEHRLPWQLVAAVSYQESQWNNEAVSYTGVRGIMQLTKETATHLGLEDRTDPVQSIWGGAKYLRYLLNKTPNYLNAKDRLYLALAAYNIGYGHLLDAQNLLRKYGRNPYSWRQLREVLPMLEDPRYAKDLEYGPARGSEAVEFVERVTSFYNLMVATQP